MLQLRWERRTAEGQMAEKMKMHLTFLPTPDKCGIECACWFLFLLNGQMTTGRSRTTIFHPKGVVVGLSDSLQSNVSAYIDIFKLFEITN